MFHEDQIAVESWATRSRRNTLDVGTMVLLSIRMQWSGVGRQLEKVRDGDYTPLWGCKQRGYEYLAEHSEYLYDRVDAARRGHIWVEDLLRDYLAVPGLGLVKAGFCVQLLTGEAGCMDMHNIQRLGLNDTDFTIPKRVDPDAQLRAINESIEWYVQLCEDHGGSEVLWDSWCNWLAETYSTFEDANDVSRRHITYLRGEE